MKKLLFVTLIICLIISSCSKNKPDGPLLIRIDNQTGFKIEEVFVNTGDGQHTFGTIEQGEKSAYSEFISAYRYAYVRLKINNVEYVQQPIDFVGETKLEPGKHTYILELLTFNNQIHLRSSHQKD
ncbi:hypothetical protein GZH53_16670 [Flavihumibacter sp. R14]|nr:hypothetical protein [Flavihumibacter soli]